MKPRLSSIKPDKLRAISDLLAVRRQYLEMSTMQKKSPKAFENIFVRSFCPAFPS